MHRTAVRGSGRSEKDPFEGVSDIVEVIKIFHQRMTPRFTYKPYHKRLDEVYASLSDADFERLLAYIGEEVKKGNQSLVAELGAEVIAFTDRDLSLIHETLLKHRFYAPGFLFKGSAEETIKTLVRALKSDDSLRRDIVTALAWSDNPMVRDLFLQWREEEPAWASEIHDSLQDCTKEAGWELDEKGEYDILYSEECYPLVPATSGTSKVGVMSPCDDHCPWCNSALTSLFTVRSKGEKPLSVKTCLHCVAYAELLYIDSEGNWSEVNVKPDFLPDVADDWVAPEQDALERSSEPRSPLFACDPNLPITFSQIGGLPSWDQYEMYPTCPTCQSTMKFIGQIEMAEVEEFGEGRYFGFHCEECGATASGYQQS